MTVHIKIGGKVQGVYSEQVQKEKADELRIADG